jgi:Tol biopolymer transport system component
MNADGSNRAEVVAGSMTRPSWSPDGRRIAFLGSVNGVSGGIWTVDLSVVNGVTTGTNIHQIGVNLPNQPGTVSWSTVENLLAFQAGGRLFTISSTSTDSTATLILDDLPNHANQPNWSPDGSKLAFIDRSSSGQFSLETINLSTKEVITVVPFCDCFMRYPNWSRHGDRIAFGYSTDGGVTMSIYTATPTTSATLVHVLDQADGPAWSPDDSELVFYSPINDGLYIYNFNNGSTTLLAPGVAFSDWRKF